MFNFNDQFSFHRLTSPQASRKANGQASSGDLIQAFNLSAMGMN
jgi:hypothetical protein